MALTLSTAAIIEKNKLESTGAYIVLCEITLPDGEIIRVCYNSEDITWDSQTWVAFPFEMDEIGESAKGEVPQLAVRLSNVTRVIQQYLEAGDGGVGSDVRIMVVHSDNLTETTPIVEHHFSVTGAKTNVIWATFGLGASNPYRQQFPRNRVLKNFCRYREFKGARCQYAGAETDCNRSLARCRELDNSVHFGGAPGVGRRGLYV